MSDTRHAVQRVDSFTGFGNLPSRMPAHQVDFDNGMIACIGGFDFGLPMICVSRRKPSLGKFILLTSKRFIKGFLRPS
jgi:hypothetical protein